jgi:hypothetical protein
MVDILTGQVEDREPTPEERGVDPAASAMGKKGGPPFQIIRAGSGGAFLSAPIGHQPQGMGSRRNLLTI